MARTKIDQYWQQFARSFPDETRRPTTYYDAFSFGTTKEDATELATLVIDGIKTATVSLKWVYDKEGEPLPKRGEFSIVTDGNEQPVCVIETTEVRVLPFDAVDEQFAWEEGEEDRTLESWRRMHWSYIVWECARIKRKPSPTTPLVCERFRVAYKEQLRGDSRSRDLA